MAFEYLFTPFQISNVEIKNRIATAPMGVCLNPGSNEINDATVAYFEDRAKGGFGLTHHLRHALMKNGQASQT